MRSDGHFKMEGMANTLSNMIIKFTNDLTQESMSKNETKIISKFSRKKKADTLIVAALELLVEHGYDEKDAIFTATKIIKSKKELETLSKFYDLFASFR